MKKLTGKDLINAARLVKRLEVSDEITRLATSVQNGTFKKNQEQIGVQLVFTVVGNLGTEDAEKCLWEFLANPFEMKPEEVAELELIELGKKVEELISLEDPEEWKSFFRQLGALAKKK